LLFSTTSLTFSLTDPDPVLPNVEDVEERSVDEGVTASNASSRDILDVDAPEDTEEGLPLALDGTPDPDSSADTSGLPRGDPLSFQNVTGEPGKREDYTANLHLIVLYRRG
jgi:hypothetical protein